MLENIGLELNPTDYLPTQKTFEKFLTEENAIFLATIGATYMSVKFLPQPKGMWVGTAISVLGASYLFFDQIKKIAVYIKEFFLGPSPSKYAAWEGFRDPSIPPRNPPPMPPINGDGLGSPYYISPDSGELLSEESGWTFILSEDEEDLSATIPAPPSSSEITDHVINEDYSGEGRKNSH